MSVQDVTGADFAEVDGDLVRIDRTPTSAKPLWAERLVAHPEPHWILDHSLLALPLKKIRRERAEELAGSEETLNLPGEADLPGIERKWLWLDEEERIAWLEEAARITATAIWGRESEWGEIAMSAPGTWDWDHAVDSIIWMRQAYVTIEALLRERDRLRHALKLRTKKM